MFRTRVALIAAALAVASATGANAQARGPLASQWRQDQAREESREGQRVDLGAAVRTVERGRPGRRVSVDVQDRGRLLYIVRWEYPGGRIADIIVDGRTGQIIGER